MTKLGEKLQLTLESKIKIQKTLEAHGVSTDGKTFADFADLIDNTLTKAEEAAGSGSSSNAAKIYMYASATSSTQNDFPIYIPTKFKAYLQYSNGSDPDTQTTGKIFTSLTYDNSTTQWSATTISDYVEMDPCYIQKFTIKDLGYPDNNTRLIIEPI